MNAPKKPHHVKWNSGRGRSKKREPVAKTVVVMVTRWIVRAYGRQMAVCEHEHDAYRIADDYRWLGVSATVTPSSFKAAA